MKKIIIGIVIIAIVGLGVYLLVKDSSKEVVINDNENVATTTVTDVTKVENKEMTTIGKSVGGLNINAYHFGTGATKLLFVGGIHGGYEWNTSLVAYELMDYLKANPGIIPTNVTVTVIPVLNPDGLSKVVGTTTAKFAVADVSTSQTKQVAGRFNDNNVDLNRNFDCDWQATGKWQNKNVSGGTTAFSEPEAQAMRDYVDSYKPASVVVWYSAAGGVYSSNCHNGILPETRTLTNTFAKASGYPANEEFDFYEITGDMVNWLAKKNIPAISVLLTNHTSTEWNMNLLGINALLKYYTK